MENNSFHTLFNFTPQDLEANKKGIISERQKAKLASARGALIASVGTYGFLALTFFCAAIALPFLPFLASLDAMLRLVFPLVIVLVALIFVASAANKLLRSRAVLSGKVHAAEGSAKLHVREYRSNGVSLGQGWFLNVGGEEFRLSGQEQYLALEKDARYRIHHVDDYPTKIVLSVEAL